MECIVLGFPIGWMYEWCGVTNWVEVKVVDQFNAAVKIVYVPLKFLPVEFCGAWDEGKAPLQKCNLGYGGGEQCGQIEYVGWGVPP